MEGMIGKDAVTQPQPVELSKDGEHPEVEAACHVQELTDGVSVVIVGAPCDAGQWSSPHCWSAQGKQAKRGGQVQHRWLNPEGGISMQHSNHSFPVG
jgi:hypothetical protein